MSWRPGADSDPHDGGSLDEVAASMTSDLPPSSERPASRRNLRASGAWPSGALSDDGVETGDSSLLEPPAPHRVPALLLRLAREVGIEMPDEQIVRAFVEAMCDLFPNRRLAVRLLPTTGHAELFHASQSVMPGLREGLVLERAAAERHDLTERDLDAFGIRLEDEYRPLFDATARGFDVPLTDGARVLGIASVEYPPGLEVPSWDAPIVVPLALELASKLRSARLLRESLYLRDYLSQLIERANAPIVVLRPDGRIENVNLATIHATGGEREQWLGRSFLEFLPESEHARALSALEAARRGEATSDVELRIPRTSGGMARIAFNTASIAAPGRDDVEGVIAIGRDLTQVRGLEEQIIQAEKLATLGQLAAGVVHELNNPLTSISVYSEYLLTKGRRQNADPADLERLGRISEAAARMLRFTRDLVTYARPSTEEPTELSIEDVVAQALVFCDHVIEGASVEVVRASEPDLPRMLGVRGQLHQVFINLVTNACHAMESAGSDPRRLHIAMRRDGERLTVTIGDDGPGIAPEHVQHIFEPFFSTKGEGRGTGLGLSIVRNIVQQHGGTISVSSRYGGAPSGTTFEVRFPVRGLDER